MQNQKNENRALRLEVVKINHSSFAAEILRGNANVNLTQMAKPFGEHKKPAKWLRTDEAKEYLDAIAVGLKCPTADLLQVRQGGTPDKQGTWCTDYRIAMRFAQWLNPLFSIAVDDVLVKLIFGEAQLTEPINGVEPLIYGGKMWYNYRDALRSMGASTRGSTSRRKSKSPGHFKVIYGQNFITSEYFRLLTGYYSYRQLCLTF